MQYIEFRQKINGFTVFGLPDIRKIQPDFDRRRLNEWQDKGYIQKLRRGYYMFADTALSEQTLFLIANKLYSPSYVSFEMALSRYSLIPEGVYTVTSASSKKKVDFTTPVSHFSYRQLKPKLMFGYHLEKFGNQNYKMADIEKAVLDYLYLNPTSTQQVDLSEWRFNKEEFLARVNMDKFKMYAKAFGSQSLEQRAKQFLKFINHPN